MANAIGSEDSHDYWPDASVLDRTDLACATAWLTDDCMYVMRAMT